MLESPRLIAPKKSIPFSMFKQISKMFPYTIVTNKLNI